MASYIIFLLIKEYEEEKNDNSNSVSIVQLLNTVLDKNSFLVFSKRPSHDNNSNILSCYIKYYLRDRKKEYSSR